MVTRRSRSERPHCYIRHAARQDPRSAHWNDEGPTQPELALRKARSYGVVVTTMVASTDSTPLGFLAATPIV
jgi:hypothetical protein